jgi:peroxiredoxin 2/4
MTTLSALLGSRAPSFKTDAVDASGNIVGDFCLESYAKGHKCLLFFYPLDFTFVCPSELVALQRMLGEFQARACRIVAVSIDSQFTHLAWRNTPVEAGGVGALGFPMVSDLKREISKAYGVLGENGLAFRASFIIDSDFCIRHVTANDLPFGRSVSEALRMLDAIEEHKNHGEVCPSDWIPGKKTMKATIEGVKLYMKGLLKGESE